MLKKKKEFDMTMLQRYVDWLYDELESALEYAEYYIIFKNSKPNYSKMYKEMASAEIQHAEYIRQMTQEFADGLSWISDHDKENWACVLQQQADTEQKVQIMLSK